MQKVLFILKKRSTPYTPNEPYSYGGGFSSGLYNSVRFINTMLIQNGVESKMVEVIDNNDIDREVTLYRPDVVVIEALWVVPEKFDTLIRLHPTVKWDVRIHSEVPFIANEGVAMKWLFGYAKYDNVTITPNTIKMVNDVRKMMAPLYSHSELREKVQYLPNYYLEQGVTPIHRDFGVLNIACFGSIRPLKNQLIQAVAAISYAKTYNKKLRFHINGTRIEQGNNVLKNIRDLFRSLDSSDYELVEHDWLDHPEFLKLISTMDLSMQVSFSETQNIVTCDAVSQNVPVVVSKEISWVAKRFHADATDTKDIMRKMHCALLRKSFGTYFNLLGLRKHNKKAKDLWLDYLR